MLLQQMHLIFFLLKTTTAIIYLKHTITSIKFKVRWVLPIDCFVTLCAGLPKACILNASYLMQLFLTRWRPSCVIFFLSSSFLVSYVVLKKSLHILVKKPESFATAEKEIPEKWSFVIHLTASMGGFIFHVYNCHQHL